MVNLSGGCRHSDLAVYPSDYKTNPSSVLHDWYIKYRFYDPAYTSPKQVIIKKGINQHTSYLDRVNAIERRRKEELHRLKDGYNPFHEHAQPTDMLVALEDARLHVQVAGTTRTDIKSMLKYFGAAAQRMKLDKMRIDSVQRKHIKVILENCYKNSRFSHNTYNHYRKYLIILFNYLCDEIEMTDHNPVSKLKKKSTDPKLRKILTPAERRAIKALLRRKKYHTFGRFLRIFFTSGTRRSELMRVRASDVNLKAQLFRIKILKGKKSRWVEKVITDSVLPLWKQIMKEANGDEYLFSEGLMPGPCAIRPEQATRRWRRHIKEKLQIDVDFYALKHLFTDTVSEKLGIKAAAAHNSHTTTSVTAKHYAVGEIARQQKTMKKVKIQL